MPAENIASTPEKGAHVRIAWGKDMDEVQVSSFFSSADGTDALIEIVNGWLEGAGLKPVPGREELDRLIREKAEPDSIVRQFGIGFQGFVISLSSRRDVNRLITAARRARDDAFGKDE